MAEIHDALRLAKEGMGQPSQDPDGNLSMMSRQFLRAYEANVTLMAASLTFMAALEASVKLQSHYASLLNTHDGGARMQFETANDWLDRLRGLAKAESPETVPNDAQLKSNHYATLRIALCDIEGGVADTLQEARRIARLAVLKTPPLI